MPTNHAVVKGVVLNIRVPIPFIGWLLIHPIHVHYTVVVRVIRLTCTTVVYQHFTILDISYHSISFGPHLGVHFVKHNNPCVV